ncbi:MAG: N-acetylglucosamine-6-phosphate deacetylase, partial [Lentisphaeria bacterium]|nr:N-acetylglucosamine-6-phosphate deacetylase [Lentisphaeria bacterium]
MADYSQFRAAADAVAQLLTHLGNGCPNLLDRHNNPVWAGLAEERLTAMLITDGHHLPGELIKVCVLTKGVDKVIVTSDATEATGYKPGPCFVLGNDSILEPNGKLHNPVKKCLVGSASTVSMCMAFLESLNIWTEEELTKMGRTNALALLNS